MGHGDAPQHPQLLRALRGGPPGDARGILPALRRHHLHGKRGGDGQPEPLHQGPRHRRGHGKEANLIDSICFYWFAYLFANLIWVFVPIPLIWKATADICRGEVKTCLPWVNPDGSVEDEFLVERLAEGDEGDEVDDEEDPFFDEDDELEADEEEHKKTR